MKMTIRLTALLLTVLCASVSFAQTNLPSGGVVSGSLLTDNEVDLYTFSAQAGDSIQIRMSDAAVGLLFPAIELRDPSSNVIASNSGETVAVILCDGSGSCSISQSGTYTVAVSSGRPTATGQYDLYFTNVRNAQADGVLNNGSFVSSRIDQGDIDAWTFDAQAGDSIQIRIADLEGSLLFPVGRLYNPDGSLLVNNSNENVTAILCDGSAGCVLPQSGTYTLVVDDGRLSATGDYNVHFVNIDGAQADGPLANGSFVSGRIELGDIDAWTFAAQAGDSIQIRIADLEGSLLFPVGRLYNPDGSLLVNNSNENVTAILCDGSAGCVLPQSGTYTLVVDDGRLGATGDYNVHFVNIDGAQADGELVNGGAVSGRIELGDIDTWTFDAQAGDSIQIRIADLEGSLLFPVGRLYNPDGTLLVNDSNEDVARILCDGSVGCVLAQSGTYTLVVDDSRLSAMGDYNLYFINIDGAQTDGELDNGGVVEGRIERGDIDAWTFDAQAGDSVHMRVVDVETGLLFPVGRLYNPDGSLLIDRSNENVSVILCDGSVGCVLPQSGTYTLVIDDGRLSVTGAYQVFFAGIPGVTTEATLASGESRYGTLTRGDLDSFTVFANAGDSIELRVTDTSTGLVFPALALYAPGGTLLADTSNENTAFLACGVGGSCTVSETGNYTVTLVDGRLSVPGSYIIERDVPQSICTQGGDSDGDGVADNCDNCLLLANDNQLDGDDDGIGNACDADISQDCIVNVVDLGLLRTAFFTSDTVADLNTDGVVNVVDLGILRSLFFQPPGPSGVPYCGS